MSATPIQAQQLAEIVGQQSSTTVKVNKVNVPFTTIQNRAQMIDPAQDLGVRMGADRFIFEEIQQLQGEAGAAQEYVFKPMNDIYDRVRLVGNWFLSSIPADLATGYGPYTQALNNLTDYLEITFWGTGLNVITVLNQNGPYALAVSVDGNTEGTNGAVSTVFPVSSSNQAPGIFRTPTYQIFQAASGLTAGTHTVKIRNNSTSSGVAFYGYEIVNASTNLQTTSGTSYSSGQKRVLSSTFSDPYNSNFESGTLGSTGGHVVVYQKSDGTIKKAVNPSAVSPFYLTSASHANETLIRAYHWREFGSGTTNDFSILPNSGTNNAAWVLDDNCTGLAGFAVSSGLVNGADTLFHNALNSFITFSFVGTGFDLEIIANPGSGDTFTVTVDGTSAGTFAPTTTGVYATGGLIKIVSGLAYGSHTATVARSTFTGDGISIRRFLVYAPSLPSIPSGAVQLADYYILPSLTDNLSASGTALGTIAKSPMREFSYYGDGAGAGTWAITTNTAASNFGLYAAGTFTTHSWYYTFVGTGILVQLPIQSGSGSETFTLTLDGSLNASAVSSYNVVNNGGGTYTVSGNGGFKITGLAYGQHTLVYSRVSGAQLNGLAQVLVITPIHSPKTNVPGNLTNALTVGGQGIGDDRVFGTVTIPSVKSWAQATGILSNPTTTSSSFVPLPDMLCTIKTTGNPIDIMFIGEFQALAAGGEGSNLSITIYVDGIAQAPSFLTSMMTGGFTDNLPVVASMIVPVAAGVHTVQIYWSTSFNSSPGVESYSTERILKVREIT